MARGLNLVDNKVARLIAHFDAWTEIFITVYGANTVYIGSTKEELEMVGPQGQQQGSAYTAANTQPPAHGPWIGDLWALASNPNTLANFDFPQKQTVI